MSSMDGRWSAAGLRCMGCQCEQCHGNWNMAGVACVPEQKSTGKSQCCSLARGPAWPHHPPHLPPALTGLTLLLWLYDSDSTVLTLWILTLCISLYCSGSTTLTLQLRLYISNSNALTTINLELWVYRHDRQLLTPPAALVSVNYWLSQQIFLKVIFQKMIFQKNIFKMVIFPKMIFLNVIFLKVIVLQLIFR